MLFTKDALYSALGRPNFFDNEELYSAADEPMEVADFPSSEDDADSSDTSSETSWIVFDENDLPILS